MTLTIWHGGQTGVDRGGHLAATDLGAPIGGWAPKDMRDEFGLIPPEVARHLTACKRPGFAARTLKNIDDSHVLLTIVESVTAPLNGGTRLTVNEWDRLKNKDRRIIADSSTDLAEFTERLRAYAGKRLQSGLPITRLMVAGPRASKWPDGERVAREIVGRVLEAVKG